MEKTDLKDTYNNLKGLLEIGMAISYAPWGLFNNLYRFYNQHGP